MQVFVEKLFFCNVDGIYDKFFNEQLIEVGFFDLNGDFVVFIVEGCCVEFVKKLYFLGVQDCVGFIEYILVYGDCSKIYQLIVQYVDLLKRVEDEVEVCVFFGFWCLVCIEFVLYIFVIEVVFVNIKVKFIYYGLFKNFDDVEVKKFGVIFVFMGVIFQNGEEVG